MDLVLPALPESPLVSVGSDGFLGDFSEFFFEPPFFLIGDFLFDTFFVLLVLFGFGPLELDDEFEEESEVEENSSEELDSVEVSLPSSEI